MVWDLVEHREILPLPYLHIYLDKVSHTSAAVKGLTLDWTAGVLSMERVSPCSSSLQNTTVAHSAFFTTDTSGF
jgi:hypothetical protein